MSGEGEEHDERADESGESHDGWDVVGTRGGGCLIAFRKNRTHGAIYRTYTVGPLSLGTSRHVCWEKFSNAVVLVGSFACFDFTK